MADSASCACSRVSATTRATGSPMNRTRSVASTVPAPGMPNGWEGKWLSTPPGIHTQGSGMILPATSAPVTAASTPGIARAALTSILRMRACPCSDRRISMCVMPGSVMSATNRPLPLRSSGSSRRLTGVPMTLVVMIAICLPHPGEVISGLAAVEHERVEDANPAHVRAHGRLEHDGVLRLDELVRRVDALDGDPGRELAEVLAQ